MKWYFKLMISLATAYMLGLLLFILIDTMVKFPSWYLAIAMAIIGVSLLLITIFLNKELWSEMR